MSKISIIDTIRGLSGLIESLFGEPPTTKDITEGFTRPTTYIQPVYSETSREGEMQHDTHELELIRFGERTRAGYLSLLEWEAKLAEALQEPVVVEEQFFLYPDEIEFMLDRDDMTLTVTLTVETYQLRDEEQAPTMESLTINRKDG